LGKLDDLRKDNCTGQGGATPGPGLGLRRIIPIGA